MEQAARSSAEQTVADALIMIEGAARTACGAAPASQILPLVYDLLRQRARGMMAREAAGHTLSPTALVHEAYLRVADRRNEFESRRHFYNAAAEAMRRILVDHARSRRSAKRGGGAGGMRPGILEPEAPFTLDSLDWLALDEAMQRLAERDARRHRVVMLRFFGGLSEPEVAEMLGVDERTVRRDWVAARVWLFSRLSGDLPSP